jgi:trans-2,3-dihydro-3-hydroxyanthranilate isomerase
VQATGFARAAQSIAFHGAAAYWHAVSEDQRSRQHRHSRAIRSWNSAISQLPMAQPNLFHVDVFATQPLSGNGLTVFLGTENWPAALMQRLTREMRQFESIFLSEVGPAGARARVFTVEEELPFAGHPVLGAAAVLHRTQTPDAPSRSWTLKLPHGAVQVSTQCLGEHYRCEMNQGRATCGAALGAAALGPVLGRLGLQATDLVAGLDAQVLSTGLPYLIVPVQPEALARAGIQGTDLEPHLQALGAKFALLLTVAPPEMRTWDNLGQVEDVATGSAAGPAAAYLWSHGLAPDEAVLRIAQGRFAGRPSQISVARDAQRNLLVSGEVWPVSHGLLEAGRT